MNASNYCTILILKITERGFNIIHNAKSIVDLKLYKEDKNSDKENQAKELIKPTAFPINEIISDKYNDLLLTKLLLPRDGQMFRAKAIGRETILCENTSIL